MRSQFKPEYKIMNYNSLILFLTLIFVILLIQTIYATSIGGTITIRNITNLSLQYKVEGGMVEPNTGTINADQKINIHYNDPAVDVLFWVINELGEIVSFRVSVDNVKNGIVGGNHICITIRQDRKGEIIYQAYRLNY
jgi:hypothetical protein